MGKKRNEKFPDDAILAGEASRLLGVAAQTIRDWIENGRLRGWWLGCRRFVSLADVQAIPRSITPRKPPVTQTEKEARDRRTRQRRSGRVSSDKVTR